MPNRFGFTLIELLVAIAIFAIMSALGWKVLSHVQTLKQRNAAHEVELFALQQAYQQLMRDTLQIVPIAANENDQTVAALVLNNQQLSFSKNGVIDPLAQGLSPFERVEYRYDAAQKTLYRLRYAGLSQLSRAQPESSVILKNIEQFEVSALNPQAVTQWPDPSSAFQSINTTNSNNSNDLSNNSAKIDSRLLTLPRGLRVRFSLNGTTYEWVFSLLDTQYLNDTAASGALGQ